jgi:glycosyltransferase involved in cell wall biosynthesis
MHVGLACLHDIESGLDLANALDEVGIFVTLYLSHALAAELVSTTDRTVERLYELELVPQACVVRLFRFPRMRDPRSLGIVRRICQTMRDDGVDVVHILMGPGELWFAVLACLVRDIPVASTMVIPKPVRDVLADFVPTFVLPAVSKLLTYGSDVIIVNGINQVAHVQDICGVPASRIVYMPLCARITAVKWAGRRHAEEPGTVLFFGRAGSRKGLEYLVRAQPIITRHVPHARIVIAAHGKDLERCQQMIQDDSKFEIHEGFIPGVEMAAFYQKACLVALPYLSASTSGVLLDAYSFGKPVVTTTVGSLPEYVEDGVTGLLVPPADVGQLANAIVRLLSNDTLRHRMGENATRWVDERQKEIVTQLLRAYEKAICIHKRIPNSQLFCVGP